MTARRFARILRDTVVDFIDGDASMLSAALAFFTMLALSPMLIVVVALASPVLGTESVRIAIVSRVAARVGVGAADLINQLFEQMRGENSVQATLIGIVLVLYATTRLFVHLQESLNHLWGVPRPPPMPMVASIRLFFHQRLLSVVVLFIIALLILVVLVLPAVEAALRGWLGIQLPWGWGERLWQLARRIGTFGLLWASIAILYKMLPDVKIEWKEVWIGSAGTAILFVAAQALIGLYFSAGRPESPYGAAGSLFVLLLWVYYQAQVFFLGAHFTHRYATRHRAFSMRAKHPFEARKSVPPAPPDASRAAPASAPAPASGPVEHEGQTPKEPPA